MTNGGHPAKKEAGSVGKKAKMLKARKSRPGSKPKSKLETVLLARA